MATKINVFATAKTQEKPKTGKAKPIVKVEGYDEKIARFNELKDRIKADLGEASLLEEQIKEIGLEKFSQQYARQGSRPDSFIIQSGSATVMFLPVDRYSKPEASVPAEEVETTQEYSFNPDVLNKHMAALAEAIGAMDIPDSDKAELLVVKEKTAVKKGAIDRLYNYGKTPEEILALMQTIQPVIQLKNTGDR